MNKSGRILAVVCVILLGFTLYSYYQRAVAEADANKLADEINSIQSINDSLSTRIKYYEGLFIFDEIEVRTEGIKSNISVGDTANGLVYVVATLDKDWEYIPNHRIVYWVGVQQSEPDTVEVNSMVSRISYIPKSIEDTTVNGFYEIPMPKGIVQIPIKIKFEVD
jgi:hypothetical protein